MERDEKTEEELYLENLYREAQVDMPEITKGGVNPARGIKQEIPLAQSPVAPKPAPVKKPPRDPSRKTEEELYLERLYNESEENGVQLSKPSLQNSAYDFHDFHVPEGEMTPLKTACAIMRIMSFIYMAAGFIFLVTNMRSGNMRDAGVYTLWTFIAGVLLAAGGLPLTMAEGTEKKRRVIWLTVVAALCAIAAIFSGIQMGG